MEEKTRQRHNKKKKKWDVHVETTTTTTKLKFDRNGWMITHSEEKKNNHNKTCLILCQKNSFTRQIQSNTCFKKQKKNQNCFSFFLICRIKMEKSARNHLYLFFCLFLWFMRLFFLFFLLIMIICEYKTAFVQYPSVQNTHEYVRNKIYKLLTTFLPQI